MIKNAMNYARRFGTKVKMAPVAAVALFASAQASAGPLADSITAELGEGKTEMLAVAAVVLGLVGVGLLIRHVRRSAQG